MSAHVLLILLNKLGKSDKMRGLPSILSLFCNLFNKFNKIGARMLDSIYHMGGGGGGGGGRAPVSPYLNFRGAFANSGGHTKSS